MAIELKKVGDEVIRVHAQLQQLDPRRYSVVKFVMNHPKSLLTVAVYTAVGAVAGSATGLVVGLGISAVFPPSAPVVIPVSTAVGGAAGGSIGFCWAAKKVKIHQKGWYAQMLTNIYTSAYLSEFLEKDGSSLQDYICPITHNLIAFPVRAPDGQIYEKAAIESWLAGRSEVSSSSPIRGKSFTSDDLLYEDRYHSDLFPILEKLLAGKIDDELKKDISSYKNIAIDQRGHLIADLINDLRKYLNSGKITAKQFLNGVREIQKKYKV